MTNPENAQESQQHDQQESTAPAAAGTPAAPTDTAPEKAETTPEPAHTFTQEDVERIVKQRLERERAKAEEQKRKATLSAEERAREELAQRDQRLQAMNARIIKAEARAALAKAGVKPDRLDYALRALDLEGVNVNDDGDLDTKTLDASVKQLVDSVPEFRTNNTPQTAHPGNKPARQAGGIDAMIRSAVKGR